MPLDSRNKAIADAFIAVVKPLQQRCDDLKAMNDGLVDCTKRLQQRVEQLESHSPLGYKGVLRDGDIGQRGYFYTHGGSIWFAKADTRARPGDGSQDWVLACKHGRDAR